MTLRLKQRLEELSIPEPNSGCQLWCAGTNGAGYGYLTIEGVVRRAVRVAWELANGPIPVGLVLCHKCDVPACINVNHLFLGTHADNMHDRDRKGRGARNWGRKNGSVKLTEQQVRSIQIDARPQTRIAAQYGVSQSMISLIKTGKNWSQVAI